MIERVSYMDNNSIRFPNTYVHVVFVVDLTGSHPVLLVVG